MMCVDSRTLLAAPAADGLVIRPDIHPHEWPLFDSAGESDDRIFFHETSGRSAISLQQCCAVESAAFHNPQRPVRLFIRPPSSCSRTNRITMNNSSFIANQPCVHQILSKHYPNVKVVVLNEGFYFTGSGLEKWHSDAPWRQSQFKMAHLSDYIRMLSMSKSGGLYMDMDMITLKQLPTTGSSSKFKNFLVYGNAAMDEISNTVFHLDKGHWLADEVIHLIAKEYDPQAYAYHGPDAISEVMHRQCGLLARHPQSNGCTDSIRLLPDATFYPIPSIISQIFFMDNGNQTDGHLALMANSFGVHLWNSVTIRHQRPLDVRSNQLAAILARRHCPVTVANADTFTSL